MQWSAKVDGTARGLAFAGGRLLVSTDSGALHCFSTAAVPETVAKKPEPEALPIGLAKRLAKAARTARGWALVTDVVDGRLCAALAEQTPLSVIGVSADAGSVAAARAETCTQPTGN